MDNPFSIIEAVDLATIVGGANGRQNEQRVVTEYGNRVNIDTYFKRTIDGKDVRTSTSVDKTDPTKSAHAVQVGNEVSAVANPGTKRK